MLKQLDEHSCILGSSTKLIFINDKKRIGNNKPISVLEIYQIDYICNILIPYLDTGRPTLCFPPTFAKAKVKGLSKVARLYNLELKNILII